MFFSILIYKDKNTKLINKVNDATHVKLQPIWLNPSIKINGKVVLNEKWQEKGIFFINDIMKTNGNGLMSVEELVFFLCFLFITYIVPHCWYMVWLKEKKKNSFA
jgi:hypothetical protein